MKAPGHIRYSVISRSNARCIPKHPLPPQAAVSRLRSDKEALQSELGQVQGSEAMLQAQSAADRVSGAAMSRDVFLAIMCPLGTSHE